VSFSVEPGTILGIVGPNGAGKTTLLKILARITPPTAGRVTGRGRVVPLLALGAGFQRELSGRDNVYLNAAMFGISAQEVTKRFDEIVDFAGLADAIDQPVRAYSSGMYLRLAFSVAINMNPDILLADEVLAVGDLEFQERCLTRVAEASRQGITVLFVSHDMPAISRLCGRALMLNSGGLVKDGTTDEIVELYQDAAWTRGKGKRKAVSSYGEMLFVKLTGADGREMGALKWADDGWLTLGFRLDQGGIAIRAACDVFARGVLMLRTVQPEEITISEPGDYLVSVKLPAGLLAETIYSVNAAINISTPSGEAAAIADHNALSFRVYDVGAVSARGTWQGAMPGVIAPALDWRFERAERPAGDSAAALAADEARLAARAAKAEQVAAKEARKAAKAAVLAGHAADDEEARG
jgi:lipopolysaccharide transport system ATP-binding protein